MTQENALPLEDTAGDAQPIAIEREAHDVSRFEWRVAVPLPAQIPGFVHPFTCPPVNYFRWAVLVVAPYLLTV